VTSRYAECRLSNLKGDLTVDGRGKIYIEDIKGNVTVKNEYSPLEITNVDGTLNASVIEGSLKVEKVTKPVIIDAKGTKVEVDDLKDTLTVRSSHRDIEIANVAAAVTIESRYGTLNLRNVKGSVSINSNSDTVEADEIGGSLTVKARGTSVRASDIRGPMDVQTTLKNVVINNFDDRCSVTNEYAGISVSSRKLGKGDLNVKNRNGDVELYLPAGAAFAIDAIARNGSVESDYAGLAPTTNANVGSLKARVKTGSPRITLETDSSDIHVYRARDEEKKQSSRDDEDDALLPSGILNIEPVSPVPPASLRGI
jgi:hypothetical protein